MLPIDILCGSSSFLFSSNRKHSNRKCRIVSYSFCNEEGGRGQINLDRTYFPSMTISILFFCESYDDGSNFASFSFFKLIPCINKEKKDYEHIFIPSCSFSGIALMKKREKHIVTAYACYINIVV